MKNFKVEAVLLKTDARLKPGMTARVDGLLQVHKKVPKIPLAAFRETTEGTNLITIIPSRKMTLRYLGRHYGKT